MNTFRSWFTPGSIVAAICVALIWLHRLPLPPAGREAAQLLMVSMAFCGLWALDRQH